MLTDRAALLRNRARALRSGWADFLHDIAAREIEERLNEVNRTFTAPAVVTGFPAFWARVLPGARLIPDDSTLDLAPQSADLILHAMAMHWSDDPVGQLIQCLRGLRPDGLFLGIAFGGRTLDTLRAAMASAEAEATGGISPRVAPMVDLRSAGALLQRAGFALPVADAVPQTVSYADPLALMRDLRAMGECSALAHRPRGFTRAEVLARGAALYPRLPDGRVEARFELVVLTGWAPHASQQQPLRPGSAAMRLADALNTREEKPD